MIYFWFNEQRLSHERRYGVYKPQKTTLSPLWKLMPFFLVKWYAKRSCPQKRINNTMYAEAFPRTFISIGKAK